MTIDEAKENAKILSDVNLKIWQTSDTNERKKLRAYFKQIYKNIVAFGYVIRKRKIFNQDLGYKVPHFTIANEKNKDFVEIKDNRGEGNHHGDCTTRCISFCTGVDYSFIQKEQMANAKAYGCYGVTWRSEKIWSKSLTSRGFSKIELPRKMTGKMFLRKLNGYNINGIIAAKSSHHLAAIDMNTKKILDVWNSAGCRIMTIYVPETQKHEWQNIINNLFN